MNVHVNEIQKPITLNEVVSEIRKFDDILPIYIAGNTQFPGVNIYAPIDVEYFYIQCKKYFIREIHTIEDGDYSGYILYL